MSIKLKKGSIKGKQDGTFVPIDVLEAVSDLSEYRKSSEQDVIDSLQNADIANCLKTPTSGIEVGKYFRVASIDSLGNPVLEACDLPIATYSSLGLVKPSLYYGLSVEANGLLSVYHAETSNIANRVTERPITPTNLVKAVDSVLCSTTASEALTDTQKTAACSRIGAEQAKGEWVLKGTLAGNADDRGNIDTGVAVDLTGCTELRLIGTLLVTSGSVGITTNVTYLSYDCFRSSCKAIHFAFVDSEFGIDNAMSKYADETTTTMLSGNISAYTWNNGKHISDITLIKPTNGNFTSCDIKIYAR